MFKLACLLAVLFFSLPLGVSAAANRASGTAPHYYAVRKPAPKLICKTGRIVTASEQVRWTGGCTYGGKLVGKVVWSSPTITDAVGTACPLLSPTSGNGRSFTPTPSARVTPVFVQRVPKTRWYLAKTLKVGRGIVVAGWDSCGGTPPQVVSLPPSDPSPLCVYQGTASFDPATRALRLPPIIACPVSFGPCTWQSDPKYPTYSPGPEMTVYRGVVVCANGNVAVTNAALNGGCIRVDATGGFVMPPSWGGGPIRWDVILLTEGPDRQPISANIVDPSDPRWNGYTPYQRVGPFNLGGKMGYCPY